MNAKEPTEEGEELRHRYSLFDAVEKGDIKEVNLLLDGGWHIDQRDDRDERSGMTPLMSAAEIGHEMIVKELIRRGAKVNLKDKGFFGSGGGYTALHYSVRGEHETIAKLLLNAGADANAMARDSAGTPLMQAVEKRNVSLVKTLLSAGADPNIRDKTVGATALHTAAYEGYDDIADLLLKHGANVNAKNGPGGTPLVHAIWQKQFDLVRKLLSSGANPSLTGARGVTPLMWAVMSDCEELVKQLLEMKVDPNAKSENGRTALDIAVRENKPVLANLISSVGGQSGDELIVRQRRTRTAILQRPDLSGKSKSVEFRIAVSGMSSILGTPAEALVRGYEGGASFQASKNQIQQVLEQEHEDYLQNGFYLFECQYGKRVGLLPTADKYEVIAVMQTSDPNGGRTTAEIAAWLRELERRQPVKLSGIGRDFLAGEFTTPIVNSRKLAKDLADICPDLLDSCPSIAMIANELRKTKMLFLWWD